MVKKDFLLFLEHIMYLWIDRIPIFQNNANYLIITLFSNILYVLRYFFTIRSHSKLNHFIDSQETSLDIR